MGGGRGARYLSIDMGFGPKNSLHSFDNGCRLGLFLTTAIPQSISRVTTSRSGLGGETEMEKGDTREGRGGRKGGIRGGIDIQGNDF